MTSVPFWERSRRLARWWQRDTADVIYLHDSCSAHLLYWLTCGQYDGLLRRSNFACEICGHSHAENTNARKPHIDHDHDHGPWAVRGLLCHTCNVSLDYPSMATKRDAYLRSAWYLAVLAEAGVPVGRIPAEPPIGTCAVDVADRRRIRRAAGWYSDGGNRWWNRSEPWTWREWITEVGPHNIRITLTTGRAA